MIQLTPEMRDRVDNAFTNRTPCILATASAAGQPSLGYKGSMMVFDDEHLAYWERTRRGLLGDVQENSKVTVFYSDMPGRVHWRFYGEATVHESGPTRDEIMARTIQSELDRDPERKGYGVLVRVDKIINLGGQLLQERE